MKVPAWELQARILVVVGDLAKATRKLVIDYMPMDSDGMADVGEMEMPLPDH